MNPLWVGEYVLYLFPVHSKTNPERPAIVRFGRPFQLIFAGVTEELLGLCDETSEMGVYMFKREIAKLYTAQN